MEDRPLHVQQVALNTRLSKVLSGRRIGARRRSSGDVQHDPAIAGSVVDVVVSGGDLFERICRRDENLQCPGSSCRRQVGSCFLLRLGREVVAAQQSHGHVGEQQGQKGISGRSMRLA